MVDSLSNDNRHDPAAPFPNAPPNLGRLPFPHVHTFSGMISSIAKTYLNPDEAIRHRIDNARYMRNDPMIMHCLEQRQRAVALLDWHIEVDGPKLPYHQALQERLTNILKATPRFTEYRRNLLEAIWYGKQGAAHAFRYKMRPDGHDIIIGLWRPVMGDKIVYRQDDGRADHAEDQVGVRVGPAYNVGDMIGPRMVVPTEQGMATFLAPYERDLLCVHKHFIEDAAYEDALGAGAIHGIGIRSRIYWTWFQKQELLGLFMEYLERSALGFEIWYYPEGNKAAEDKIIEIARNRVGRRNIITFPKPLGDTQMAYGVEHVEPNAAGAEQMMNVLNEFYGHMIKRYILGQTLTSEAAGTGLGSGVADLHLNTLLDIIKYDATNLEETITRGPLDALKRFNDAMAVNVECRFVIQTETPNLEEKLQSYSMAFEMGCRLKATDVMEAIGAAIPEPTDEVLQNPAIMQAQMQMQQMQQQQALQDGMMQSGLNPADPNAQAAFIQSQAQGNGHPQAPASEDLVKRPTQRIDRLIAERSKLGRQWGNGRASRVA